MSSSPFSPLPTSPRLIRIYKVFHNLWFFFYHNRPSATRGNCALNPITTQHDIQGDRSEAELKDIPQTFLSAPYSLWHSNPLRYSSPPFRVVRHWPAPLQQFFSHVNIPFGIFKHTIILNSNSDSDSLPCQISLNTWWNSNSLKHSSTSQHTQTPTFSM